MSVVPPPEIKTPRRIGRLRGEHTDRQTSGLAGADIGSVISDFGFGCDSRVIIQIDPPHACGFAPFVFLIWLMFESQGPIILAGNVTSVEGCVANVFDAIGLAARRRRYVR
jgi:hypothetical protein